MRWSIIAANQRCKKRYAKCEASGAGRIDRRLYCRDVRYTGRQDVCEPLLMRASVKAIVGERIHIRELRMTAMKIGLKKFRLRGAMEVAAGETRIAEVLRVAPYSGTG